MDRLRLFLGRFPERGCSAALPERRRSAALRLRAARRRFDRSTLALRKAAFDHIDQQARIGTILEASLARLAAQGGPA